MIRFLMLLVAAEAAEADEGWVGDTVRHLRRFEFEDFFLGLKSLFAHLPYGSKEGRVHEMSYERALKILFWSQGLRVETEDPPARRREGRTRLTPPGRV